LNFIPEAGNMTAREENGFLKTENLFTPYVVIKPMNENKE